MVRHPVFNPTENRSRTVRKANEIAACGEFARPLQSLYEWHARGEGSMIQTIRYLYWQENETWLGSLEEYPDYWTQGESLDELIEHLEDLYLDATSGQVPGIRRIGELTIS